MVKRSRRNKIRNEENDMNIEEIGNNNNNKSLNINLLKNDFNDNDDVNNNLIDNDNDNDNDTFYDDVEDDEESQTDDLNEKDDSQEEIFIKKNKFKNTNNDTLRKKIIIKKYTELNNENLKDDILYLDINDEEYKNKIINLNKEYNDILNDTHPDLIKHLDNLKKVKTQNIKDAEQIKRFQLKNLDDIKQFELLKAEKVYQYEKEEIKNEMLEIAHTRLAKRRREYSKLDANKFYKIRKPDHVVNDPKINYHKKTCYKESLIDDLNTIYNNREKIFNLKHYNKYISLQPEEIANDMEQIYTDLVTIDNKRDTKSSEKKVQVYQHVGRLYYANKIFQTGDEIIIRSKLFRNEEVEYNGTIEAIGSNKLYVELITGRKAIIHYSHLRKKKLEIKLKIVGNIGIKNLIRNGWIE